MPTIQIMNFTDIELQALLNDVRAQVVSDMVIHKELTAEQASSLDRSQLVLVYRKGWFKRMFDRFCVGRDNAFGITVVRLSGECTRNMALQEEQEKRDHLLMSRDPRKDAP